MPCPFSKRMMASSRTASGGLAKLSATMWHRRSHTEAARAVADYLNDHHDIQLSDEDLTQALASWD
jgi:hypothetical protein